jgi:hypothetical protein
LIIAEDAPIRVLIRNHLDFKGKVSRKRYLHFRRGNRLRMTTSPRVTLGS